MDQDLSPKKGCSVLVKVIFTLSIILNILFLLAVAYGYGVVKSFTETGDISLPIIPDRVIETSTGDTASDAASDSADHPMLNPDQEKMLQGMGIDVAKLPTEITPAMEDCFTQAVGAARAEEIKKGSVIGPLDILKAKACL